MKPSLEVKGGTNGNQMSGHARNVCRIIHLAPGPRRPDLRSVRPRYNDLTIVSVIFLASPNSIMVLAR
jgi:hypothetical protein